MKKLDGLKVGDFIYFSYCLTVLNNKGICKTCGLETFNTNMTNKRFFSLIYSRSEPCFNSHTFSEKPKITIHATIYKSLITEKYGDSLVIFSKPKNVHHENSYHEEVVSHTQLNYLIKNNKMFLNKEDGIKTLEFIKNKLDITKTLNTISGKRVRDPYKEFASNSRAVFHKDYLDQYLSKEEIEDLITLV